MKRVIAFVIAISLLVPTGAVLAKTSTQTAETDMTVFVTFIPSPYMIGPIVVSEPLLARRGDDDPPPPPPKPKEERSWSDVKSMFGPRR